MHLNPELSPIFGSRPVSAISSIGVLDDIAIRPILFPTRFLFVRNPLSICVQLFDSMPDQLTQTAAAWLSFPPMASHFFPSLTLPAQT